MIRWNSFSGAVLVSSVLHLFLFFTAGVLPRVPRYAKTTPFPSERMLDVLYAGKMLSETPQAPEKEEPEVAVPIPDLVPDLVAETDTEPASALEEASFPAWPDPPSGEEELSDEEVVAKALRLTDEERPLFYAYYQTVRERIRRQVQRQFPPGNPEKGEVALSFILFSNGKLKTAEVLGEKGFRNRRLRELAVQSVIHASPFPPFPEGLHRPFIPFRVVITFVGE